jgi:hypothetical protein
MWLFLCCLWGFSPAHAAELKVRTIDGRIIDSILEGEIRPGDYDRFVQQIHKGGLGDTLWLNSPGGDAFEAMKIGSLIRELRMTTHAPDGAGNKTFCLTYPKGADLHQCNCASACFLIFVAGTNREGTHLGVHRVFPRHERLKSMSPDEAAALQRVATREVSNYLKEMGVPTHFIERLVATPSDQIEWVKAGDIERYFSGFIPEYSEWMAAKCKDNSALFDEAQPLLKKKKMKSLSASEDRRLVEIINAVEANVDCRASARREIRKDAEAAVIAEHICPVDFRTKTSGYRGGARRNSVSRWQPVDRLGFSRTC